MATEQNIPADLRELWKYASEQIEPIPVDPEDMKNFILRIAAAELSLNQERIAHRGTLKDLTTAQDVISTTCKRWLEIVAGREKKNENAKSVSKADDGSIPA